MVGVARSAGDPTRAACRRLPAIAGGVSLNWGSEVNPSQCPTDQGYRYLEINVTRTVEGDPTQGVLGNTWAIREYNQHVQVWRIGASDDGALVLVEIVEPVVRGVQE